MLITPLTTEPASITAGDTISWQIALPDYPATAGWTLKYKALHSSGYFELSGTAAGADHLIAAAKTVTANVAAGVYTLVKYVESGSDLITLAELPLTVRPNLAAKTAAFDNRTHVKRVLDAIESVLEGTASTDQQELTIDGTTIKRRTVAELLTLRSQYLQYYKQEQASAGLAGAGASQKILVRFT